MVPLSLFSVHLHVENILLVMSLLMVIAMVLSRVGEKMGVPVLILCLGLGLAFGPDGVGMHFSDIRHVEVIGLVAVGVILISRGLRTDSNTEDGFVRPGIVLSVLGSSLVTLLVGVFAWVVLGIRLGTIGSYFAGCCLMGAVLCSTGSTFVNQILGTRGLRVKRNVFSALWAESVANVPVSSTLTFTISWLIVSTPLLNYGFNASSVAAGVIFTAAALAVQVLVAVVAGRLVGRLATWVLGRLSLPGSALYAILVLSMCMLAYAAASFLKGCGLLALVLAAVRIGRGHIPFRKQVLRFFAGLEWTSMLVMYLLLGLIARPSQFGPLLLPSVALALLIIFVVRPVGVGVSLLANRRYSLREKLFISMAGFKGMAPILFAITTVGDGVPGAGSLASIVFIVVAVSLVCQSALIVPLARWTGAAEPLPEPPRTFGVEVPMEIGVLLERIVTASDLEKGPTLRDQRMPHDTRVVVVNRDGEFMVPHGSMGLHVGDRMVVLKANPPRLALPTDADRAGPAPGKGRWKWPLRRKAPTSPEPPPPGDPPPAAPA